jgi:hypothetical protein
MGKKHEKIKFDYSKYFNYPHVCKQCRLSYPDEELQKGICFICREENKFLEKLLEDINIINNRIKIKRHKLTK